MATTSTATILYLRAAEWPCVSYPDGLQALSVGRELKRDPQVLLDQPVLHSLLFCFEPAVQNANFAWAKLRDSLWYLSIGCTCRLTSHSEPHHWHAACTTCPQITASSRVWR